MWLTRPNWQRYGTCGTLSESEREVFFPDVAPNRQVRKRWEQEARSYCADCPVQQDCAVQALVANERWGVWGGLTSFDRARLLRISRDRGIPVPMLVTDKAFVWYTVITYARRYEQEKRHATATDVGRDVAEPGPRRGVAVTLRSFSGRSGDSDESQHGGGRELQRAAAGA